MNFPNNAHGDALRRIYNDPDFEDDKEYLIDINVDFNCWPPSKEAISLLEKKYGKVDYIDEDEEGSGYLNLQFRNIITYDFIITKLEEVTELMKEFDGYSDCWGVMVN